MVRVIHGKTVNFASYHADFRWGLLISIILATVSILFFGALYAMTGLPFIIQPFIQAS